MGRGCSLLRFDQLGRLSDWGGRLSGTCNQLGSLTNWTAVQVGRLINGDFSGQLGRWANWDVRQLGRFFANWDVFANWGVSPTGTFGYTGRLHV